MQFASNPLRLSLTLTAWVFAAVTVLSSTATAQQPGPFSAQDFQPYGPGNTAIPPELYGPDLDGGPDEITLSVGAVEQRLKRLGFHSFSQPRFRNGYWNIVAYHGKKKRALRVHPHTGVIQSDKPYCNNRCNHYQLSDEF